MTKGICLLLVYFYVLAVANFINAQIQGSQSDARKLLLGRELLQISNQECKTGGDVYYQELSGGVDAPPGRYPYMVAIQVKTGNQFNHHCGGTLIAPNLILTAAHCIYIQGKYDLRAIDQLKGKLGKNPVEIYAALYPECRHQAGKEARILINQYYLTSDYSGNLLRGGDIAILQTQKSFNYGGPFINYAASLDVNLDTSRLFSSIGYGATDVQDLNSRAVDVIPLQLGFFAYEVDDVCQQKLTQQNPRYQLNLQSNVCFGYKGLDTCSGDSGGPMLLADDNYGITPFGDPSKDIQVGITSWGPVTDCSPGDKNNPGVYTRVSNYVDWISSVVSLAGKVVSVKASATAIASTASTSTTSPSSSNSFVCSDKKPPGTFTCQQQLIFGKCDERWMISGQYCQQTCVRCLLGIDGPDPKLTPNTAPSNGEVCSDIQPDAKYTCDQQRQFRQCNASWMINQGFCKKTCGRCNTQGCSDIQPPGLFTCDQQRQFQKCNTGWMINSNYCQKTCGRCGADSAAPLARSTRKCFGEPQANYKGEIILLGTENFKDSIQECCTSCEENPYCNVYVYCPRLEGCRNLDQVLNYGRCDLKFQQAVEDGKEPEVWYRGNETDFTSGYILAKNIQR